MLTKQITGHGSIFHITKTVECRNYPFCTWKQATSRNKKANHHKLELRDIWKLGKWDCTRCERNPRHFYRTR